MTEVVILVVSTTLLFFWLLSLRAKAVEMRRQPVSDSLTGDDQPIYRE
ncbi:hypothetical protein QKW35_02080 [Pontibacterium granulatum]|nr:hypothetical protein [Pontibacterium granulatum]MDI3323153.1 hypothetical protein [Pontibacterium granulatum]